MTLDCSVVVATYNRSAGLRALLRSLAGQDIDPGRFEVVVVDDGSQDDTWEVANKTETPYRLRAFRQANQGPAAARNRAIEAAEGRIIVTLDDDLVPAPDLLRRHLEAHDREPNIAAMGKMLLAPGAKLQPWVRWEEKGLNEQYEMLRLGVWPATPRQFYTANASAPREVLLKAGLFDAELRRAEDVELAYRLEAMGVGFRFLPDAVVHHVPNRTYAAWQSIPRQYGYYDVLMWKEKGHAHLLGSIQMEFREHRHRLTQTAVRLLTGRPLALAAFIKAASAAAYLASRAGIDKVANATYSLIFNLLYYRGAAEAFASYGIDYRVMFES
jgi:glycosyltransferase involved in cell wall biosynthesis